MLHLHSLLLHVRVVLILVVRVRLLRRHLKARGVQIRERYLRETLFDLVRENVIDTTWSLNLIGVAMWRPLLRPIISRVTVFLVKNAVLAHFFGNHLPSNRLHRDATRHFLSQLPVYLLHLILAAL